MFMQLIDIQIILIRKYEASEPGSLVSVEEVAQVSVDNNQNKCKMLYNIEIVLLCDLKFL